jgi:hypothetical protein
VRARRITPDEKPRDTVPPSAAPSSPKSAPPPPPPVTVIKSVKKDVDSDITTKPVERSNITLFDFIKPKSKVAARLGPVEHRNQQQSSSSSKPQMSFVEALVGKPLARPPPAAPVEPAPVVIIPSAPVYLRDLPKVYRGQGKGFLSDLKDKDLMARLEAESKAFWTEQLPEPVTISPTTGKQQAANAKISTKKGDAYKNTKKRSNQKNNRSYTSKAYTQGDGFWDEPGALAAEDKTVDTPETHDWDSKWRGGYSKYYKKWNYKSYRPEAPREAAAEKVADVPVESRTTFKELTEGEQ